MPDKEHDVELKQDDDALIELTAIIVRRAGETQDPRIADIAIAANDICKSIPGIFEKMLLRCTEPNQPTQQPYNPFMTMQSGHQQR